MKLYSPSKQPLHTELRLESRYVTGRKSVCFDAKVGMFLLDVGKGSDFPEMRTFRPKETTLTINTLKRRCTLRLEHGKCFLNTYLSLTIHVP